MKELADIATGFAAIGSEPRLKVILTLVRAGDKGMQFGHLQMRTKIPAATLSHHIRSLLDAGLIDKTRQGRDVTLKPNYDALRALSTYILDQCCADQFDECLHQEGVDTNTPHKRKTEPHYDVVEPVEDIA